MYSDGVSTVSIVRIERSKFQRNLIGKVMRERKFLFAVCFLLLLGGCQTTTSIDRHHKKLFSPFDSSVDKVLKLKALGELEDAAQIVAERPEDFSQDEGREVGRDLGAAILELYIQSSASIQQIKYTQFAEDYQTLRAIELMMWDYDRYSIILGYGREASALNKLLVAVHILANSDHPFWF
jgi:hypothetical protein